MGFFNTLGGTTSQKRNYRNLVEDEFGNPIPAAIQQNGLTMPQSGMFGAGKRGMSGSGIVATPQQQATTNALEKQFPNMPVPTDQRDMEQQQPSLAERMQAAIGATQQQPQLPDSSNQPRQIDPDVMKMIGNEPAGAKSFWRGGKKFGVTDGIAGILAVLGDGLSRNRGYGNGGAVQNLVGGRTDGLKALTEAQAAYRRNQQVAGLPGMNAREFAAFQADPKAWGSNMSDAYSTHHAAATVNPSDLRVFGNPNQGGSVYQAPTRGQQYADSLGYEPGTDAYSGALRDQELGANGPTAFGNQQSLQAAREAQARYMEQMRQQGRMGMEGLRQTNRSNLRGTPTYRDLNPPARGSGGSGGGRQNIPTVSSPAEAKRLPSGTKFRTPDGRVMQVP